MAYEETTLVISGLGLPPYSARGLKFSLKPISQNQNAFARDVNLNFVDISVGVVKYALSVQGDDVRPPAFDGLALPAGPFIVDWAAEFSYLTADGAPSRAVVDGSSRTEGDYTFYRPSFSAYLIGLSLDSDEWASGVTWSLDFEEA